MTKDGIIAELQKLIDSDEVKFYFKGGLQKVIETVEDLQEIKHGEWIADEPKATGYGTIYECTFCGYEVEFKPTNYCPNCGADMRGESE